MIQPETLARAMQAGLIMDGTTDEPHISRTVCTCGSKDWGAGCHRRDCSVARFYDSGRMYAQEVLEKLLSKEDEPLDQGIDAQLREDIRQSEEIK